MRYSHTHPIDRLCQSLEASGGGDGGTGTVLDALRERFVAVDRNKTGFLDATQFRTVLADLPGVEGLTVSNLLLAAAAAGSGGAAAVTGAGYWLHTNILHLLVMQRVETAPRSSP